MDTHDDLLHKAIDSFWDTIPQMWGGIRKRVRKTATEEFGMSVEQFHTLRLVSHGVQSVGELADHQHISRPAVSQTVDGLVERGLLLRTTDKNDRRFVRLDLTEEGGRTMHDLFGRNRVWMAEQLVSLSREDLEVLIQALAVLRNCFDLRDVCPAKVK